MKEVWEDEYGQWSRDGNLLIHVEPSQKWKDENPPVDPEPPKPSPTDLLAEELVKMKFDNMQKDTVISSFGEEITKLKFELMALKGGE